MIYKLEQPKFWFFSEFQHWVVLHVHTMYSEQSTIL